MLSSNTEKSTVHIYRTVIQVVSLHIGHTTPVHPVPLKMIMMLTTAMMMKKKNGVCHIDRHPCNQQPCSGHCPVVLQIVWYTHAKGTGQ